MTHDEAQSLLDAWLDNELDPAAALAIEAHVHDCQSCGGWLAQRRSMLEQVRAAAIRYPVPAELSARIRNASTARRHDRTRRDRCSGSERWRPG